MRHPKRTAERLAERRVLVESTYGPIGLLVATLPRKHVHVNDLLDAFAALWTAERIARLAAADRARPCFAAPSPDDAEVLDAADPTPCSP